MIRMVWANAFNLRRRGRAGAVRGTVSSSNELSRRQDLVRLVAPRALAHQTDVERAVHAAGGQALSRAGLRDLVLSIDEPLDSTDPVFRQLRWGGQFLFITH